MCESDMKGNKTEINCIAAFINLGYMVFTPVGESGRYDFIADIDGQLLRIQCKTARKGSCNGSFQFENRSMYRHNRSMYYTKEEIDYFATFYNGQCYLVPIEECGTGAKTLRLEPPINNKATGINWASDYELEKMIHKIINE